MTGPERTRIAAAQSPVTFDPSANGDEIRRLMHTAHDHGARLVQFPEGAVGFRFGCMLCIEINFPELVTEYLARDVDCVLFSSHSQDPIFDVVMRGHAAANNLWFSVSVPAHCSAAMPAGVVGPHGYRLGTCSADGRVDLVCVDLDRRDPALDVALNRARPWRAAARAGEIYARRRVSDPRSADGAHF